MWRIYDVIKKLNKSIVSIGTKSIKIDQKTREL